MEFTDSQFDALKADIKRALEGVAAKYDITIDTGNITYSSEEFTLTLKVERNGGAERLARMYPKFGRLLGRTFREKRHSYTVVGYDPYAKRFKIKTVRDDGVTMNWTEDFVTKAVFGEED